MNRLLFLFFSATLVILSCQGEKDVVCENLVCTEEFRTVSVKFIDGAGKPLIVREFKAVNQRTKESMITGLVTDSIHATGIYTVASDANLRSLSEAGDTILISAKHPENNTVKESNFVVTGGKCACHIAKVSGVEEIVFD